MPGRGNDEVFADVRNTLAVFAEPGSVVEARAPKTRKGLASGYFDGEHLDNLAWAAVALTTQWHAESVYFLLNPCRSDLLARAVNVVKAYAKHTTSDDDIVRLRWLLIDLDPVRPAGISSTDAEHDAALARAHEVRDWLVGQGWPRPILADSGNGAHVLPQVNLPNTPENRDVLRRCLQALDLEFSDNLVKVDTSTFNPARITKLYGTFVAKGDSTAERPHRYSALVEVP